MHLKEIYLENFKSFGRKVRIPFLEGFTAVTGPNGSGKSNIADAILFVLGPKSSKIIRAGKLTDLIFNGGDKKKPAKYCKVTLLFDNVSRLIPIDSDEVRLTRLVKISKTNAENYYSYFYINGKPSSLGEFDNILAHARISADGYNFVQQGDINRITQMGKIERRRIFDDIAGITKFDQDISKANEKRESVLGNLDRIQILLDEIKLNLNRLKHDRDAAMKYKKLRDELYLVKAQLAYKKKEEMELKINSLNEQIGKLNQEQVDLNNDIVDRREELMNTSNELEEIDKKLTEEGGEEAKEIKKQIEKLKIIQYRATDTIENSRDDIREAKDEKSISQRELKTIGKELREFDEKQNELSTQLEAIEEDIKTKDGKLKDLEGIRNKSSTEIMEIQREIGRLSKEIDAKHDNIRTITLDLDRSKEKVERFDSELLANQEELDKIKFEIDDITWRFKEQEKKNKDSGKIVNDLTTQYHQKKALERELTKQAQELEEATNRLNREYMKLKARKDAAESIQKNYSQTVERVLEARDRGILTGIYGTIAELAEVDKGYETALTIAAGRRLQAIVTDNDGAAAKAIEYIKSEKLGRATFLPLTKMVAGRPRAKALICERDPKSLGFAIDLIKFDEKYLSAFWYVFNDTIIVEDLKSARQLMGGVRLVTKAGEIIESGGAMIGGNIGSLNLRFGAPSESDFNNISELLRRSIEESERVSEELHTMRDELMELEEKLSNSKFSSSTSNIHVDDLKSKKAELTKKLKSGKEEYKLQVKAIETEQEETTKLETNFAQVNEELDKLVKKRNKKHELVLKSTPQKLANEINSLNDDLNQLRNIQRDHKAELKTISTQVDLYENRKNELKGNLEGIERRIKENNRKIEEAREVKDKLNDELNTLLKVEEAIDRKHQGLRDKRDLIMEAKLKLDNMIDKIGTKLMSNGDLILSAKTKLETIEDSTAEIEAEIQNYDGAKIEGPIPPAEQLSKSAKELEVTMARLEPINMKAIEDYDIQAERKEKLDDEFKQLKEQEANLLNIVNNLNKKKKDKLLIGFNGVNDNFKKIYNELSGGGTSELFLENEDEPFEGGLIIKAKPPGKKQARLEALSGGEKSVVSMALIFAIQQYQPSPFYVLDEVDQNLDAINAEKVANMVRNDANTAQFLMISLRKVSLNKAHHVYGVTIQKNGITDIIGKINLHELGEKGEIPKTSVKEIVEHKEKEIKDLERGGMFG